MTAVIGIPLVMAIIILGNPYLKYTVMLASLIGMFEFYRVVSKEGKPLALLGYSAVVIQYVAFESVMAHYFVFVTLFMIVALTIMVFYYPKYSIIDIALTLLPVFYVSLLFSFLVLIRDIENGIFWIWLIAISAWGSDTFAYFTGITMGKHKLAPQLSPKKTIEGSLGGVIGAGVLGYVYTMIFTQFAAGEVRSLWLSITVIVMVAAVVSQIGDLAASAIKRFFDQKDYGHILPGHGGILDRCDSFIFVAPIIYIMALLVQNTVR